MQKNYFKILVQTALTVGLFWIILKLTHKSALLSFTILYSKIKHKQRGISIDFLVKSSNEYFFRFI